MQSGPRYPAWLRLFHNANLILVLLMAASGLQIYNANPVFGGRQGLPFPLLVTLGGWLAGGRFWHFGLMGLYAFTLAAWLLLAVLLRPQRLATVPMLLRGPAGSSVVARAAWANRLVFSLMLVVLAASLVSGVAMYKPASLWWLSSLFGSWSLLRIAHFATLPLLLILGGWHVVLSRRIGGERMLRAMTF